MDILLEVLEKSFKEVLEMLPFLFLVFLLIEIFEHKLGEKSIRFFSLAKNFGPAIGALLGVIPQCGLSVMGVILFSQKIITPGTLISIFIATSDEALPIFISTPGMLDKLIPFIIIKFIFAVFWGYVVDLFLRNKKFEINKIDEHHDENCCGKSCLTHSFRFKEIFNHAFKRTFSVFAYLLVFIFSIELIFLAGNLGKTFDYFKGKEFLEILIASFLGLIPSCATSVFLAELYLKGSILFSSMMAGLSSNAGLALLVLFKEVKNKKIGLILVSILTICSLATGIILFLLKISI